MKEEAKKQLESISIVQIKEILKNTSPEKFDTMIITDNQLTKRGNYVYAKMKYEKVERQLEQIKFPLYDAIKDNFAEIEGGESKFGEKYPVNSNKIFDTLKNNYHISGEDLSLNKVNKAFNYPIDEVNNEISKQQKKYFFPDLTYQETCDKCNGEKYVKCTDRECDGRHNWICTNCHGDGKISCDSCAGDGKVTCKDCKGHGYVKCGGLISISGCNGKGYVEKKKDSLSTLTYRETCTKCHGKGEIPCKDCGTRGEVKCEKCSGRGEVQCRECSGKGDITCSHCYGDRERYGRIDCPQCATIGKVAQIVYVDTFVSQNENEKVILKGDKLIVNNNNILTHVKTNQTGQLVFSKVNEKVQENYDEFSKEYSEIFENDLNLSKNNFPLVTKESIFYQIVPCVELSYKHMLTNTVHEFTILDIWNNPEIIYHSEPEQLKQDLGNVTKVVGGFFGKLFKTKAFNTKGDRRNEIVLLIHLAKIDGIIEEHEKIFLSEKIGNLDEFTNSEKQKLFDLMNAATLPDLLKADVTFSSKERGQEVIDKLTELASADGQMDVLESTLINKIKSLM